MITLAYDPDRIRALSSSVRACLDALADCRSHDSAATDALRVVHLTRSNLELQWLPLLERIARSTAMAGGPASWPPALREIAELLGRAMVSDMVGRLVLARRASELLAQIVDDPDLCLALLSEPAVLGLLARNRWLDAEVVEQVVTTALHRSVVADRSRLGEVAAVLTETVRLANGVGDHGFPPGFARGVAAALPTLLPSIAPALGPEGAYPVIVIDREADVDHEIGTYADLEDLFGALLRDERAQVLVGEALGEYARTTIDGLGDGLVTWSVEARTTLAAIEAVTDLVSDATWSEQAELVAEAAARTAFQRRIGQVIGAGAGAALTAVDASQITKLAAAQAIGVATDFLATSRPEQLGSDEIRLVVHDVVLLSVMRSIGERADVRAALGLADDDPVVADLGKGLRRIDATGDPERRRRRTIELVRSASADSPVVAALIADLYERPGFHEIVESRRPPQPD